MTDESPKKKLGELLKDKGLITDEHISFTLQLQKITKEKIGELLVGLGLLTEYDITTTLAEEHGFPFLDLDEIFPDEKILALFNKNFCLSNGFLPVHIYEQTVDIAAENPADPKLEQLISRQTGLSPMFYMSEKKKIINAINNFYYFLENPVEKSVQSEINILSNDLDKVRGMDNLIKHILHLAVKMRGTDIHIRPMKQTINIALRVDGVMNSVMSIPISLSRLVSSIKMKADMDIAEQRLPQDGRFSTTILSKAYDLRVSTIVSPHGEDMAIRILPVESPIMGMRQLGFFNEHVQILERMFNEPFGIILLTGPTGSGKSTTLYAGIRKLNLLKKNVLTVISPIDGTPAAKAGIKAEDIIIKVDGESTKDMELWEAVKKMRGEKGTSVTITILRENEKEAFLQFFSNLRHQTRSQITSL